MDGDAIVDLEVDLLLDALHRLHGYDFRDYARAALRRRLLDATREEGQETVTRLLDRMLRDEEVAGRIVRRLTVSVTSMFRDPGLYRVLREEVVPVLRTWPFIRCWHAGCSTGEEVYSVAILLHEEGLLERSRIYATDVDEGALRRAAAGSFPLSLMQEYTRNYQKAGGREAFSSYYSVDGDDATLRDFLLRPLVFSRHDLVSDGSFNEFHLVFCRNVLIYFNERLQRRVHDLVHESLARLGFLVLGSHESLHASPWADAYRAISRDERVFQRVA